MVWIVSFVLMALLVWMVMAKKGSKLKAQSKISHRHTQTHADIEKSSKAKGDSIEGERSEG